MASAQTTASSAIASGYGAVPQSGGATAFSRVQDSFTVPTATCAAAPNGVAAMRVGIGGVTTGAVERVGITETCSGGGTATYAAFYQMYPAAQVNEFVPKPGDNLDLSVSAAPGGVYTLSMQDLTSGESFTVTKLCASTCPNSSAQATAGSTPGAVPANFTAVNFGAIIVTDTAGVSGGMANAAWGTITITQTGSPNTVAGVLKTSTSPPESAFKDTWNA